MRFVDGQGNLVRAGGKVVKNAAGFDLPKFMAGSLGGYGYLVELSFKVMPSPAAWVTVQVSYPTLEAGLEALVGLTRQPLEIYALDMQSDDWGATLFVRLGGAAGSLPPAWSVCNGRWGVCRQMSWKALESRSYGRRRSSLPGFPQGGAW